jgi:outer membrane protein assembly factor BamB
MVNDKGVATFLDARTGAAVATLRLGGNFSSSPLFADGRIYVGNREGDTFVIAPGTGAEPKLLSTNHLDGRIFATPAAVGDSLYLRTDAALYRITNRKPAP